MRQWSIILSLVVANGLAVATPALAAAIPESRRLDFTVLRDGDPVGHDILEFVQSGDQLKVQVKTNVAVKIAFVTVYRFEHQSTEIWQGGRLAQLVSRTNDDGTGHILDVRADSDNLRINGDNQMSIARRDIVPASLWNEDIVNGPVALNTLDGTKMAIAVQDLGMESVMVRGHAIQAHHYAITGQLQRELWYDARGVLVQVRFKAKDKSEVLYALR